MPAANTVTTQASPGANGTLGVSVNVVPESAPRSPWTVVLADVRVPLPQAIWNQLPATVTGSLNVSAMVALGLTPVAFDAGIVAATKGASSTGGGSALVTFA